MICLCRVVWELFKDPLSSLLIFAQYNLAMLKPWNLKLLLTCWYESYNAPRTFEIKICKVFSEITVETICSSLIASMYDISSSRVTDMYYVFHLVTISSIYVHSRVDFQIGVSQYWSSMLYLKQYSFFMFFLTKESNFIKTKSVVYMLDIWWWTLGNTLAILNVFWMCYVFCCSDSKQRLHPACALCWCVFYVLPYCSTQKLHWIRTHIPCMIVYWQ